MKHITGFSRLLSTLAYFNIHRSSTSMKSLQSSKSSSESYFLAERQTSLYVHFFNIFHPFKLSLDRETLYTILYFSSYFPIKKSPSISFFKFVLGNDFSKWKNNHVIKLRTEVWSYDEQHNSSQKPACLAKVLRSGTNKPKDLQHCLHDVEWNGMHSTQLMTVRPLIAK